jgi:hypothetical protein
MPRQWNDDDHLPALPPLDDGETGPAQEEPTETPEEPPAAWDDDPSDEDLSDAVALPEPVDDEGDDGPEDDGAEEVPPEDGERWSGDDDPVQEPLDEATDTEDPGADDLGEEGPAEEGCDALDELPALDDGAEEEDPLAAAALETLAGVTLRRVSGVVVVTSLALGAETLYAVGDGLRAASLALLEDPSEFVFEALELPPEELPLTLVEDRGGALTVGCASGRVLRQEGRSAGWAPLDLGALDAVVELATDGVDWVLRTDLGAVRLGDGRYWSGLAADVVVHGVVVDLAGGPVEASGACGALALVTAGPKAWVARAARSSEVLVTFPEGCAPGVVARRGELWLAVDRRAGRRAWVSLDGGAHWARAEALDGATAVTLVETDDGAAAALGALPEGDGVTMVELRLAVGAPATARRLCALDPPLEAEEPRRAHTLLPLDRAGRRVAVATEDGVWLLER